LLDSQDAEIERYEAMAARCERQAEDAIKSRDEFYEQLIHTEI
jgi:hypothetical protein